MADVVRSNSTKRLLNADLSRRKSGDISAFGVKNQVESMVIAELPWGSLKVIPNSVIEYGVLPARYSAQTLLVELFNIFERKLNQVCNEDPVERMFNKSLRRNEDPYLDNLLRTLNGVCEVCLPSVLSALKQWYDQQQKVPINENGETPEKAMKRALAASYLYCVVLIEILPQVHFYPNECDQLISQILITSFRQISYRDPHTFGNNYSNSLVVAETFGEVIGVLSQSHFKQVHKLFSTNLDALRKELPFNSITVRKIISLLMAMKFFRIKVTTFNFEMGVSFLDELGSYYLEVDLKQKDLKHALAGLLVEILLPAAGEIKTEANIPSLIAFVDKLYSPTYELVNKKAHRMFLNLTLANLKNKDMKMSRVALESLYRLLWVYTIRINCEGNTATRSRLESICSSLFPKGNRNVIPKDSPIIIFVKIIHFIAYQKLDFAFKEIIFDLLGCNRVSRTVSIYPERMNIGIRALMVITDGLQQKEGPPGMPRSMGPVPPSGTIQRIKKTYITRPLTPDVARSIGLDQYYYPCRKAFDAILRTLDTQVGRNLLLTSSQTRGKEPEDIIVGDELIELLTRMCIHVDEELRVTACQTLQNLITECAEWREDIINTHLNFLTNNIQDTFPTLLESTVRFLLQLLCAWKSTVQLEKKNISSPTDQKKPNMYKGRGYATNSQATTCSIADSSHSPDGHTTNGSIGSEIGSPYNRFHAPNATNPTAIAVHNQSWNTDFASACDKIPNVEPDAYLLVNADRGNEYMRWDPWACALSGYCEYQLLPSKCPTAVGFAWPALFLRMNYCTQYVDPANPQNENRASLLRSSKSKASASSLCGEALSQDSYLSLWQNGFGCYSKHVVVNSWEHMTDMRDSVVLGVGSTNPMYFEHLLDEFANRNILRETQEKKLESNARRRKRRDLLRLQVLRVVEVGLFRGLLEYGNMVDHQTGQLSPVLLKILDSVRDNVLADSERDISVLTSLRLHFAKTITLLVSTVPTDKRRSLLPIEFKNELVSIFFKWCGRAIGTSDRGSEKDVGTYVEQQSVSNIFGETLSLILHLNDQNTQLFEWTITTCYTRQNQMAVKAFKALVLLFSKREFPCVPCDFVSLFVLGLVYALDADSSIKQSAILLLQVLRKQFLDDALSPCQSGLADSGNLLLSESQDQIYNDLSAFPTNFCLMSRQLSSMYTQLTMPIFSEVCCRLESARPTRQSAMLSILLQWIGHIELVDPYSDLYSTDEPQVENGKVGWGSTEATQLLLNNLVYITAKFSAEHEKEIAALWSCLAASYPANLPVIVHIIFVMVSLSPEFFIPVVKRISGYLLCACGERFIVLLMQQLNNSGEQFKFNLIRSEIPPFYKWQQTQNDVDDEAASPRNVENSEPTEKSLQVVNQMYSKPNAENEKMSQNKLNVNVLLPDQSTVLEQMQNVDEMLSVRQPKQLPMPAYGGHYANLSSFLPPSTQPVAYFSRSNLALFLLSELVGADTDAPIIWDGYASALLNVSLTSMDSSRSLVCRSARLTILSLCLHFAPKDVNIGQVASLLLSKQVASQHNEFLERFEERFSSKLQNGNEYKQTSSSLAELNDLHTMNFTTKQAEYKKQLFFSDDLFSSNTELLMALCYCLTDIISGLASKWTDVAMKTALTTSNRHIADTRYSLLLEHSSQPDVPPLNRCRSAATINLDSLVLTDDSVNALSQLIAVCACLLESQVDNEFLLSIHLLNRILECCGKEREQCVHHFDNTIKQLEWSGYNGIVPLAAKGVIYSYGCENAVSVLRQLIDQLNYTTIGSFSSFPLIYCSKRLPERMADDTELATSDHPLHNLATMMNQYREGTFPRDKFQWAKCVVNYLIDAFSPNAMHLVVFASEVLERSTSSMHVYLLHIIYLLISHGDLNDAPPVPLNAQVVRVVTKHIQSVNWKEAARILKCIMTQWNRISVSQIADGETCLDQRKPDFDLFVEKALTDSTSPQSPRKLTAQPSTGNGDSLRRQTNNSQVIFSQSSSDVHHDGILASTSNMQTAASNSAFSSSEVVSHQDDLEAMSGSSLANAGNESITTDSFPRVFKEFDFLEAEHDSVSESNESCFNWLSTMRPSGMNNLDAEEQDIDEINDPDDEYLIQNEDELDDDVDLSANSSADQSMHIRSFVGRRRALNLRSRPNRPLSRTSDSNDISSDRTPMQSEKHSDESIPSCSSASEDEADEVQKKTSQAPKFYTSSAAIITSPMESSSTTSLQINDEMPFNAIETTSSIHCRSEVSSQNRVVTSTRRYPLYLECSHHLSGLESCVKLSGLLRDASHMMASSQTPERSRRDISPYFTHALHVVLKFTDCPFVFITSNFTLNAMKSTLKLQNLGSLHANTNIVNQEFNLSPAVTRLQEELHCSISELPPSESRLSTSTLNVGVSEQQVDMLILHLTNKNYKNALITLRQLRSQFGNEFGCCEHMDVEVLLMQYCRSHKLRTWAMIGPTDLLRNGCDQLKETNMQFTSLVRTLVADASTTVSTPTVRSSRVSSVNESNFNPLHSN
ncbi:hypothetical protein M3Y94_00284400 [Aphelenchoides besseyi]|nr:hypothetical protein M3Y94_00284400 [Aphelenchoides besseyi]